MGSGKTTAMLNMINENPDTRYLFVTPYLEEVTRVIDSTGERFKTPYARYPRFRRDTLHEFIAAGQDIVTTHALFHNTTDETIQLLREKEYTLILDEAMDIISEYNEEVKAHPNKCLTGADVSWLFNEHLFIRDPDTLRTQWNSSVVPDFMFSEVVTRSLDNRLHCIDNDLLCIFPCEIFSAFKEIYILTYRFEGTFFDCYLKKNGFEYTKISSRKINSSKCELCAYEDDLSKRRELAKLIHIYKGPLNYIGNNRNAFSIKWLNSLKADDVKLIQNNMRNYLNYVSRIIGHKVTSNMVMWTTTKKDDFYKRLQCVYGFKYIRRLTGTEQKLSEKDLRKLMCFVPCNARATNDFQDRSVLLYLVNRFPKPEFLKLYKTLGYPIDEDVFALNELLQWIWRSQIRNNQEIYLYIPSKRMRKLLCQWLGKTDALDEPHTKRFKKVA